ncbi:hypothetical protein ANCCEY_01300 [Ancylostoma ceylanicum]|uniref:Uncharacterized protein n=1 Tax=Ancylostoma ceylanicum TaxID=53326 RepID=A0A0D6M626_9BILA|nr:hypothetical protein ANCCEY_01300 [Ancylostoma ceylanicum]
MILTNITKRLHAKQRPIDAVGFVNGFLPFPPWGLQVPQGSTLGSCAGPQVSAVVVLLRLTPLDITAARDAMTLWTFDDISRILHDRASQVEGDAINALTVVQKGHIGELSIGGRSFVLDQIMNGIILSLPEEVQVKAGMSSQLESMQSVLPPTVSPGWNDPPNLGGAAAPAASNRLAQLRKRPVDPSISSSSAGGGMMTHQPGQPPDHGYPHGAGDNRHPGHSQHHNSPEQYGVVPTPVSVGIPTSPPVPGVTTTQATVQMFAQPQQQYTHHVAPVHSSSTAISAPQLPQTTVTATHLPQGALEQHYPTTTATPYTQAMPAAHPTLHYNQSPMGTSVQSQDVHAQNAQMANHQQFFHQQQYHGAPPIHRRVLGSYDFSIIVSDRDFQEQFYGHIASGMSGNPLY